MAIVGDRKGEDVGGRLAVQVIREGVTVDHHKAHAAKGGAKTLKLCMVRFTTERGAAISHGPIDFSANGGAKGANQKQIELHAAAPIRRAGA